MENLGWLMYLCSIADGVESVATLFLVISIVGFIATAITYANLDCELATAKRWWKKFLIIGIPLFVLDSTYPFKGNLLSDSWNHRSNKDNQGF